MTFLIVILLLYLMLGYSALYKKRVTFISFLILLCCFYDFLFIELSYYFSSGIVQFLKPFQEIILLFSVLLYFSNKTFICRVNKYKINFFLFIFIPLFYVLIITLNGGFDFGNLVLGIRCFFLPYLISYFIFANTNYKITIPSWVFGVILITAVGYSLYQEYTFNGSLTELWHYKSRTDEYGFNSMDTASFNYLKQDKLRCMSYFVSAIDLSAICGILGIYYFIRLLKSRKVIMLMFVVFALLGIYLSRTRIGLFTFALGVIETLYIKKRSSTASLKIFWILPVILIVITFTYIGLNFRSDESSIGRLVQYGEFLMNFNFLGKGFSKKNDILNYDSYYLSSINLFGVLGILYIAFYFILLNKYLSQFKKRFPKDPFELFVIICSSVMIYTFAFHHIAGSFLYWLIIVMITSQIRYKSKPICY